MVGQNIGKYKVLDRIGRGGMGTVYRAIDETLHREVAIKVLNAEMNDPAVAKRFQAEAITVARLNHPAIATVYELFQNEGQWLMVMEFLRGETLEALVVRKGPLPIAQATDLCMQVLGALAHAHSLGVVHRDLKPANLMATESGVVKVMDFGIARVAGTEHLTSAGFMMGTPAYMAPEQVLGEDIDARADIYAMGAVFFHLLTSQLPFQGKSPFQMAQSRLRDQPTPVRTFREDAPEWVGQIIDLALNRYPSQRFQSAPQFHDALRRGLAGLPLDLPVPSVPPELMVTAAPGAMPVVPGPPARTVQDPMETVLSRSSGEVPMALTTPAVPSSTSTPSLGAIPPLVTSSATPVSTRATPRMTVTVSEEAAPPLVPVVARPAAAAPGPETATAPKAASRAPVLAIVAALVLVAGVGGWMFTRSRSAAPVAQARPPAPVETPVVPAGESVPPGGPSPTAVPATGAPSTAPPIAPATPPAAPSSPGPSTRAEARGSTVPAGGNAASATGAVLGVPLTRGRAAAVAPAPIPPTAVARPPVEFKDTRLLVIAGKKADERAVILRFGDGVVAAVVERAGTIVQSMSEKDVSYAAYTRAKDPKWSVILAGPPAGTDFPGGMFRSTRHWLTLQSRSAFLIFRLNDADWRRVVETVKTRTGLTVEMLSGNQ